MNILRKILVVMLLKSAKKKLRNKGCNRMLMLRMMADHLLILMIFQKKPKLKKDLMISTYPSDMGATKRLFENLNEMEKLEELKIEITPEMFKIHPSHSGDIMGVKGLGLTGEKYI